MLRDLIIKNRSYRRFDQSVAVSKELLLEWVDLARYAASGRNIQPLKYYLSCELRTAKCSRPLPGRLT
jgi:nitroreductase